MEDLLRKYAATSPAFQFEFVDPEESPAKVRELHVDSYGVTVVCVGEKKLRIESASEQEVTNALKKILTEFKRTIYFVTGHEEAGLNDEKPDGYSSLLRILEGKGYFVKELDLAKTNIPKTADLVVLAGPHSDLPEKEIDSLASYLDNGGKLFLALDPVYAGEGDRTRSFLLKHGILLGNDVVVDKLSMQMGTGALETMAVEYNQEVLKDFHETVIFPVARSVKKYHDAPAGWHVSEMVRTSLGSWAETNLKDLEDGKADYDEGVDFPGPVSVGVIAEGGNHDRKIAVIGDSDFLANAHVYFEGNNHFALKIFSLLLNDVPLVKIAGQPSKEEKAPHDSPKTIFSSMNSKEIEQMSFQNFGTEEKIVLKRIDQKWLVTSPIHFIASELSANALLGIVMSAEPVKSIPLVPSLNLGEFKLEKPDFKICIQAKDEKEKCLAVGGETPFGDSCYVRFEGEDKVLVTNVALKKVLQDKTTYALAQKQLFPYVLKSSKKIIITQKDFVFEFASDDNGWQVVKPVSKKLSDEKMEKLLMLLTELHVREFLPGDLHDPKFGLDGKPTFSVQVEYQTGTKLKLVLGSEVSGVFAHYGFYNELPQVFTVAKEKVDELLAICAQYIQPLKPA